MANRPTDPEFLALLDAPAPTSPLAPLCAMMGIEIETYWTMVIASKAAKLFPRVHTGYAPKVQRRAAAHLAYSNGLLVAPRRMTVADKAQAEARAWGLAS